MTKSAAPPLLLTVPELALILRTTNKAIYAMLERGQLPAGVVMRLGRRLLFRRDAVMRWIAGAEGS